MHGPVLPLVAVIGIPDAGQCLFFFAPFLALAAAVWIINRTDRVIDFLFPHWEWEKQLGWLNIRAQRRADTVLRWIGYIVYVLLASALYGIVWSVQALPSFEDWSDPAVLAELTRRLPVLLVSVGLWLVYLGCTLYPKLRDQHEMDGLEKFRAEQAELEKENAPVKPSRVKSPLLKPRWDATPKSNRLRRGSE